MKRKDVRYNDNTNIILTIPSVYNSMTKAVRRVADTVLKAEGEIVGYTITDLAEKAGVGETSVIRFCRALGFSGYHEFILTAALGFSNEPRQIGGDIDETDDTQDIISKITAYNSQIIEDTQKLVNPKMLEMAAKILLSGKNIHVFGVGSSGVTAMDVYYRLMRIGLSVNAQIDSHIIAMKAALLKETDIVFGISTSGSTKDLVDPIKNAKQNGATIICLTSHVKSPITQFADVILLVASKESPFQGGSLSTKIAQIHVLDILSNVIIKQSKEEAVASVKKTANAVACKLY